MIERTLRGMGLVLALQVALFAAPRDAQASDARLIPLVDQRGAAFRIADLTGKRTAIIFIATRCTDACPIADAEFYRLYTRLRRDGGARLLTITLDPGYDTPFVMSVAAARFAADPDVWRFASGRPDDLRRLLRAFGVVSKKGEHGVPDVHTTFVYVLDRNARLAQTLLLSSRTPDEVERALRTP
jgi:protein SCO1/2